MSLFVNTKIRTNAIEIMDDFSIKGEPLYKTLDQLAVINKWLGGNRVTLNGLKQLLRKYPKNNVLKIIDLGCGNGDMLRVVADYLRKHHYKFKLVGIDANVHTINYAIKLSSAYPEISYLHQDIFSDEFKALKYDVVLATLFLHHFRDDEIIDFLDDVVQSATIGTVINDLHRHKLAYYLFKGLSLFVKNPMVKEDGLISILRGFKRGEIERFSKKLNIKSKINWRWAFRFSWLLRPLSEMNKSQNLESRAKS